MRQVVYLIAMCSIINTIAAQKVKLFNGKNLNGWHIDVPAADTDPNIKSSFIVRGKNLVSLGKPEGHIITDKIYSNYELNIEYRFAAEPGNCGVLVHASKPRMLYKMFPQSIEVQMEHTNAGDFWVIGEEIEVDDMEKYRGPKEKWGKTEGKERNVKARLKNEKPLGQWNKMKIRCQGNKITVWLNGKLVNDGYNCTVSSGQIALQAEGSEVEFRKVELKGL